MSPLRQHVRPVEPVAGERESIVLGLMMDQRFRIEGLIGTGGVGQVYRAHDRQLDRRVALKLIRSDGPREVERLLAEARTQARIAHPNVAEVFEVGRHGGRPCIAMEFVDGPSLEQVADELEIAEGVRIVRDVARAVYAAHQVGLIHRDLKPANVLLERRGDGWHPFVVDFGLATQVDSGGLTATDTISGTPRYMAPEQVRGERSRSIDIWALGAMLYRLAAGRTPHDGESNLEILVKVSSEEAPPVRRFAPSLPDDLASIVDTAVAAAPEARYASAAGLAEDLDRFLDGRPVSVRPVGPVRRLGRWARRHRALTAAAVLAAAALFGVGGWGVSERVRAGRQAALGQQFGAHARDIAWWMRAVELAPRHDVRSERQNVRERIAELRRRQQQLGRAAAGPAAFAIGRAYLALSEPDAARTALEAAAASGFDSPDLSEALGTALAELYRRGLARASWIRDQALRERRIGQLRAELAEPALRQLGRALSAEDSALTRSRQAFLEDDYTGAAVHARRAYEEQGWRYEAYLLEAAAVRAVGDRHRTAGDFDRAEESYARADEVLREAAGVAESSAEVHLDRCALWNAVLDVRIYRSGEDPGEAFAAAESACSAATEVAPDLPEAWARWSAVYRYRAVWAIRRGESAREPALRAGELARRALEVDPNHAGGLRRLGLALRALARWQARSGEDPRPAMREALEAMERSARIQPDAVAWSNLGLARSSLARQEALMGGAPEDEFERAVEALRTAVDLAPEMAPLWLNLGEVRKNLGVYQLDHGRDARPVLRASVSAAEKAVELNPDYVVGWRGLGLARWYLGDALWQWSADPEPMLAGASDAFERVRKLDPEDALGWVDGASVELLRARVVAERGGSPEKPFQTAGTLLEGARECDPDLVWLVFLEGLRHLQRADWLADSGRDPTAEIEAARKAFDRGLGKVGRHATALADRALVETVAATWAIRTGHDPTRHLDRARGFLDEALQVDPEGAPALAASGDVLSLRAAAGGDAGEESTAWLAEASRVLEHAASVDSRLARVPWLAARVEIIRAARAEAGPDRLEAVTRALDHARRAAALRPRWQDAGRMVELLESVAGPTPNGLQGGDQSSEAVSEALALSLR